MALWLCWPGEEQNNQFEVCVLKCDEGDGLCITMLGTCTLSVLLFLRICFEVNLITLI